MRLFGVLICGNTPVSENVLKCCGTLAYFLGKSSVGMVHIDVTGCVWSVYQIGILLETHGAKAVSENVISLNTQYGFDS